MSDVFFHKGDIIRVTEKFGPRAGTLVATGKADHDLERFGFATFRMIDSRGDILNLNINSVIAEVVWSDWTPPFEWPTAHGSIVEGRHTVRDGSEELELFQLTEGEWYWAGLEGSWDTEGLENECANHTFTVIRDGLGGAQ